MKQEQLLNNIDEWNQYRGNRTKLHPFTCCLHIIGNLLLLPDREGFEGRHLERGETCMAERVKYGRSPLIETIYQLRFPTILSINSEQPVDFQSKIREKYPFFEQTVMPEQQMMFSNEGVPSELRIRPINNYQFVTEDGNSKINLTSSFIAFSTVRYDRWEEFSKDIDDILPTFIDIYKPKFYTRIGLRYKDIIIRSKLGLEDKKWTELLKPRF